MANILIIDDDHMLCNVLRTHFGSIGHNTAYALTLEEGLREVSSNTFDIVFLDVCLPDGDGLEALPGIRKAPSSPEVIIITGEGDPDGAELAIKSDAWTYIEKPFSIRKLDLQIVRALQYRKEKAEIKPPMVLKRERIVGSSPQLQTCLELLAQVANSEANVLITGETGTGKELFAKTIHNNSSRAGKSFVVVDCTALPETLVESMLFGHEKGAFTGADKARVGLIKEADGGTLFLDEVGELPSTVQKDFLRTLQEYRFRPLGSNKEIGSDFRLVSATNRDLEKMVQSEQFRRDLFYRLNAVTLDLPPLRTRPQDIKDLAMHYMVELCERYGTDTKGFSPEFFEVLTGYGWPGNVRELIHAMERVLTVARLEPTLFPRHLPTQIRVHEARAAVARSAAGAREPQEDNYPSGILSRLQDVREAALSKVEKQYLRDLMLFTKGDIKEACRISALSRARLYALIKKYEVSTRG
jgi:two-component system NtrC family response regulator